MRRRGFFIGTAMTCLMLAACSDSAEYGEATEMAEEEVADSALVSDAAMEGEAAPLSAASEPPSRPDIPISLPRMAYVYDYGFRLDADAIAPLQTRHADMCEEAGPYVCQIVSQSQSGDADDDYATGRLELAVVADKARAFGSQLGDAAASAGGEQVTAAITGEDLSKNMVDTEARLRSRIALRDRMMEVLRTRRGSVEELVAAERSVAQINEEIDVAQSWLAEMRQRVAFTRINIDYASAEAPAADFLGPVRSATDSVGSILGYLLAIAIVLGTIGLPVLGGIFGIRWAKRRLTGEAVEV